MVEEGAKIGANTTVGPFTYITKDVVIGENNEIMSHVVIKGHTTIGNENRIFPQAVIGEENQDKKYDGEETTVVIGDRNVIRESVQIHVVRHKIKVQLLWVTTTCCVSTHTWLTM
ncbi:acyl-[acyl-carrier-protein]-UDP-N-acetylglucosamine O-acyltransferase [Vibrio astriarenae]|nr:acyl-[acyl-carrier-protein]-UDP-N-acetylglucosamine O-acyltransferase [Vibrio sp. C7]